MSVLVGSWMMKKVSLFVWLNILIYSAAAAPKTRHLKWEVEYNHWSPDGVEGVVITINGQFPGPTIRARAGDTLHVELTNHLHTEGVVIHWHGIRQVLHLVFYFISITRPAQPGFQPGIFCMSA